MYDARGPVTGNSISAVGRARLFVHLLPQCRIMWPNAKDQFNRQQITRECKDLSVDYFSPGFPLSLRWLLIQIVKTRTDGSDDCE